MVLYWGRGKCIRRKTELRRTKGKSEKLLKNVHILALQVFTYTSAKWEPSALSSFADKGRTISIKRALRLSPP